MFRTFDSIAYTREKTTTAFPLRRSRCGYNVPVVIARLTVMVLLAVAGSFAAEIIDPSELRPGDRGVCVTEVEGGTLLEIPIRVLGVMGANGPEGEIVLIRLEDERFEKVGIVAGMSGSPVYIDGRLLGALAFGWQFASEPIAGVTPFTRMQNIAGAGASVAAPTAGRRPSLATLLDAMASARLPEVVLDWLAPESAASSGSLPLAVAGVGAGMSDLDWPNLAWRRMGWVASPAGGGAATEDAEPIRPGSMVAAVLVTGDAHIAAGGTVTEVSEERLWAFGHPFLSGGSIRLPLARASVVTILPSLASSFKIFNVGPVIGSVTADRAHGVLGELGDGPSLIPLEVFTADAVYRFGIVDHALLSPLLTGFMVYSSHAVRGRGFGLQTVDVGLRIEFVDDQSLAMEQIFEGADAPAQCAAWTSAVLGYLAASPFSPIATRSITVRLATRDGLQGATILDVVPERRIVAPGEVVAVRVRLLHAGGVVETRKIEIRTPAEVAEGRLDLVVADGVSWTAYDLGMRPIRSASFDDERQLLEHLESSRKIVVALETPGVSVVLPGGTVAVPQGVAVSLQSGLGDELETASYRLVALTDVETDGPVLGATRVRLDVRRRVHWDGDSP